LTVQTKTCPSCGAVVPVVAYRCKECFHDLAPPPPRTGPMPLLAAVAGVAVLAAGTFWLLSQRRTDEQILVDETSHSVQWIHQFADGHLETDRLPFDQVSRIRYEVEGGEQRIVAVTTDGAEKVVEHTKEQQLASKAAKYAEMMQKPLEVADGTQKRD
jgi:hypothetical protein